MRYITTTIDGKKMVKQMPESWTLEECNMYASGKGLQEYYAREISKWEVFPSELNPPDGIIVEEGKDFRLVNVETKSADGNYISMSLTKKKAIPLTPKQESEDELWEQLEDFEIPNSELYPSDEYQYGASQMKMALLNHIQQHYHITKKTT